jgi:hypothetical protein
MKYCARSLTLIFCFLLPAIMRAQSVGQVDCPGTVRYVYLYSSMTTMEVRTTLKCGEQVQITVRYDGFFGVRTAKGEAGFVPLESLLLVKDPPGPKASQPRLQPPPAAHPDPAAGLIFALPNGIPIHLKLVKTLSSATAHVGDQVELEVVEEVVVDGLCVIAKGAAAVGVVVEAEARKRMGHGGKLGVLVKAVRLSDNERAAVRSYLESAGTTTSTGTMNPLAHGKDVELAQGTEFTAYADGDKPLKRESFQATKTSANPDPVPPAKNPPQPPGR